MKINKIYFECLTKIDIMSYIYDIPEDGVSLE